MTSEANRARWLALYVLCLGDLMIVLDGTIVNVALPSIRDDLGFSQTSLSWVVNSYLLTFGGFLLLGGRLGDLFGHRKLFLGGISLFTVASLACGLANSQELLIAARAVQGIGGAVVSAVAFSLLMTLFQEPAERAKAMGVFGFVLSGGGVVGVLAGGFLTDLLNWHWIFLVNIPVGVAVYLLSVRLLPKAPGYMQGRVDWWGALTITASLMIAVYAVINGNQEGWGSAQTLGLIGVALALFAAFVAIEAKISLPLAPLGLFRSRNVSTGSILGGLMAAGLFAYFFMSALYMQLVLEYTPMEVGLAYLPGTIVWGSASLLLSDRLAMRYGIKPPMLSGMALTLVGLLLLARVPVSGDWLVDIMPATVLLGLGMGIAFNPILLAAMNDVPQEEAGLASGVINTAFMMGGALGLAALVSLADWRSDDLLATGEAAASALTSGYHAAFLLGSAFVVVSAVLGATVLRVKLPQHEAHEPHGAAAAAEA